MQTNTTPYEILVGVGTLYIGNALAVAPAVNATPDAAIWRTLGDTDGGVKVTKTRTVELHRTDQSTGPKKATMTEEGPDVSANLVTNTLENMADVLGLTVTDTPPGAGSIGTRKVGLHSGDVKEFAVLFRGKSPYGDFEAQYWVPRVVFIDDMEQEFTKDGKTMIPFKATALEDPNAATQDERFGIFTAKDAAATS